MKNKYVNNAKISEKKFRLLLLLFSKDLTATQIAELTKLNRNTVNRYVEEIRNRIAELAAERAPIADSEVEIDESYFGAKRVRGRRGRGARGKTIVFGLLKRDGCVYTQIVKDVSAKTLKSIIEEQVDKNSTIYSDGWKSYDGIVDWGYKHHYRVHHGENEFVSVSRRKTHINGIESFWGYAKNRLVKFNGIRGEDFVKYIKECEFRFNMRDRNIYKELLKIFRKNPLF